MDKYETRRAALRNLVDSLGRGGISRVAEAIGKEPNYVSRMLYEENKPGRKRIGEDTAELLARAFPRWVLLDPSYEPKGSTTLLLPTSLTVYAALEHLSQTIDSLSPLIREAGNSALVKWASGLASDTDTAATLDALSKANEAIHENQSSDKSTSPFKKAVGA